MGFNSAFKGLKLLIVASLSCPFCLWKNWVNLYLVNNASHLWKMLCCLTPSVQCLFYMKIRPKLSYVYFFCCGAATQRGSWPPLSWGFLYHTQRHTTVGRIPLDKWSARRRDLYLTTHITNNRKTSMPPVGLKPTILEREISSAIADTVYFVYLLYNNKYNPMMADTCSS
jgi:hypothetical protein